MRYTDPLNNSLIEIDLSCNPITNAGLEIIALFLSSDQNIIYNLFPNAISRLSQEFSDLDKERFENISRNLLAYISKDKQMEAIHADEM